MPTSFRTEKGILFITITGKHTLDDALEVRAEAAETVREQAVRKVVFDARIAEIDASTNDIFQCTSGLGALFPRDAKLAVVFSPDTFSLEDAAFAETVAVNRGVLLRAFTQPEEARDWLLEKESPA